jgi:hypothetical protein
LKKIVLFALTLGLISCDPQTFNSVLSTLPTSASTPALSNQEVIEGLKEALKVGTTNAVAFTSKTDGFLQNPKIRIPFPPEAEKVRVWAMNNGMKSQVEKFEMNLNRTAEKAAGEATTIFVDAVMNMSIQDGFAILKGDSVAATSFLRKNTETNLKQKFSPIIDQKIDEVKLTSYWEPITKAYNTAMTFTGGEKVNTDLKSYVLQKSLDGLFVYVASEESKIRKDPAARISAILVKVFGQQ